MLADTNFSQAPKNVLETIAWLLRLGRPPLPECPLEAAKQGRTQKQPQFFDGKRVVPVNWQEWQKDQPIPEVYQVWFRHPATGIGTLGGWNGRHWLGWVDFDVDNFESVEAMLEAIANWFASSAAIANAPQFFSPSGGYRVLLAFEREPETGANNGFSFSPDADKRMGELLIKNGGHTLLPPTVGANGKPYQWVKWTEYPPIFPSPQAAGLFPIKTAKGIERQPHVKRFSERRSTHFIGQSLTEILERDIYPRLSADRLFGDLEEWKGAEKNCWCPFCTTREKAPSFNVPRDKTTFLCYGCRATGSWADYIMLRSRCTFSEAVALLADMTGVPLPEWKSPEPDNATFVNGHRNSSGGSRSVASDTQYPGDTPNPEKLDVPATVTAVTEILNKGLSQWEERFLLDGVIAASVMSKESFWQLVASQKTRTEEVLDEDLSRVEQAIAWSKIELDWKSVLPHLADDLLHDANILNVEPMAIWQYLLPTVMSLAGSKVELDVDSHIVPCILWCVLVGESGGGKTRGKKLVTSALEEWQKAEKKRYLSEQDEYAKQLKEKKKDDENPEQIQPPLPERKYLFEVATIQALLKKLSEQINGNGSLLGRDELAGFFKSLGQFTKNGTGEGLEIFLALWDGTMAIVDRIMDEDSFIGDKPRLSLAGGIQPGAYREAFRDPDDAQGLQARMLPVLLKVLPKKRTKGSCYLSEKFPQMFEWIDKQFPSMTLKLSKAADKLYTNMVQKIGEQAELGETPAIRAWMRKLDTQLLRIAMGLHLIECYHETGRPKYEIQVDTFNRAIEFCRYYRNSFYVLQDKVTDSQSIPTILTKIWDMAANSPAGVLVRDIYRGIKAIPQLAKQLGRETKAFTLDLCSRLQGERRGYLQKEGRKFRFVVAIDAPPPPFNDGSDSPPPTTPPGGNRGGGRPPNRPAGDGGSGALPTQPSCNSQPSNISLQQESPLNVTVVTKPETYYQTVVEVSSANYVSPVTVNVEEAKTSEERPKDEVPSALDNDGKVEPAPTREFDAHIAQPESQSEGGFQKRSQSLDTCLQEALELLPSEKIDDAKNNLLPITPLIAITEALALLRIAQHLLPSTDAKFQLFQNTELLTWGMDLDANFWVDFSNLLADPMPLWGTEIADYDYGTFPHHNIQADLITNKNAAHRIRNDLIKATTFKGLCKTLFAVVPEQLEWVAAKELTKDARENIWAMVREWIDNQLYPQIDLAL